MPWRRVVSLALSLAPAVALGAGAPAGAQDSSPQPDPLPLEPRERPFLLLDAPHRSLPTEPAQIRLQLRDGGRVTLGLFRLHDARAKLRLRLGGGPDLFDLGDGP